MEVILDNRREPTHPGIQRNKGYVFRVSTDVFGDSVELPKWLNFGSGIKKSAKRWQFLAGGGEP